MAKVGPMVKSPEGWVVLKGGPEKKKFGSYRTALIRSGPKVAHWLHKPNWSGSVRWTKQTLHPKKGGVSVI